MLVQIGLAAAGIGNAIWALVQSAEKIYNIPVDREKKLLEREKFTLEVENARRQLGTTPVALLARAPALLESDADEANHAAKEAELEPAPTAGAQEQRLRRKIKVRGLATRYDRIRKRLGRSPIQIRTIDLDVVELSEDQILLNANNAPNTTNSY